MKTATINGVTFSYDDDLELTFTLKPREVIGEGGGGGGRVPECRFCKAGAGVSGAGTHYDEEGRTVPCLDAPGTTWTTQWPPGSGGGGGGKGECIITYKTTKKAPNP